MKDLAIIEVLSVVTLLRCSMLAPNDEHRT